MALWQWHELQLAFSNTLSDGPDVSGISIDSRTTAPGDLFIALSGDPGPRFHGGDGTGRDGHEFIDSAFERGAVAALVSQHQSKERAELLVDDTLDGLWQLGRVSATRGSARRIAITGSSGKTTAKTWLHGLLQARHRCHASIGSLNNHWGVPLSLARMPRDTEIGIFEIGTNHPGEISPLSQLVSPDVALVLNVLPAHIGNFPSIDALRQEKLSISSGLSSKGQLVVPYGLSLEGVTDRDILTFGLDERADVSGSLSFENSRAVLKANVRGRAFQVRLATSGEHTAVTALALLAVIDVLGLELNLFIEAFSQLILPDGRGNEIQLGGLRIIDDSYNANPTSMSYSIETLGRADGRRFAILGEILELGEASARFHAEVAEKFKQLDGVITVGAGFNDHPGNLGHYADAREIDLASLCDKMLRPGDSLLVKGSNKVFWVQDFVKRLRSAVEAQPHLVQPLP